jgi:hypothetical protein
MKERDGQVMAMKNDFANDLRFSLDSSNDDFINKTYQKIFPHVIEIQKVTDLKLQKSGVDKIFITDSGKAILVDEKIRRKWYGDILLEEFSDYERKTKGWIGREKHTDYIAYIILPTKTLYLLPFLLLQKVWIENYDYWLKEYGRRYAINESWKTSNIPIPTNVLLNKIRDSMTNRLLFCDNNFTQEKQQLEFPLAGG